MSDALWLAGVQAAGLFHFVTLVIAWRTPIPPDWEENLARLPEIHRRFAIAQNAAIGAVIVVFGLICLLAAPALVRGDTMARCWSAAIALWWGGRLIVLPWLGIAPTLTTPWLRWGFRALQLQCAIYSLAFAWLALRGLSLG